MAEIQVNFKGVVERSDFEGGVYGFEVAGAVSDNGQNGPYVRVTLTFIDGKYAGLNTEDFVSLAPKALWRAKAFLRALGYDIPDAEFRFRTEDLVQLRFRGVCAREIDPSGKYPPKLRVNEYHLIDWTPPPQAVAQPGAAPEAGAAAGEHPAGGNGEVPPPPTPPPAATVAVSRPKLKV